MSTTSRVFVAGGSGTIGVPLVRALVQAGHQVTAQTRSPEKQRALAALGATPVVADALDPAALADAMRDARPTHVIHQLTALPKDGVRKTADLAATNRLRIDGTRNLLAAAIDAGARRIIVGSFAPMQGITPDMPADVRAVAAAVASMESQVLDANRARQIDAIVLRYGLFYGPGNPATQKMIAMARRRMLPALREDRGLLPLIHLDDAVRATIAALDRGTPGSIYPIVDDRPVSMSELVRALADYAGAPRPLAIPAWVPRLLAPFLAVMFTVRLSLSNETSKNELGWRLLYPTIKEGLARTGARAA